MDEIVETAEVPEAPVLVGTEIADRIAEGIARGIAAAAPPRKVTVGRYDPRSPFHPDKKLRVKALREYYQNNYRCNPELLFDEEIALLNQITRPGRYIKRKVEVIIRNEDMSLPEQVVELRYSDKTPDQRFENARLWTDFRDMLKKIIVEQEVALENAPAR